MSLLPAMIQVLMMLTQSHLMPDLTFLWQEAPAGESGYVYTIPAEERDLRIVAYSMVAVPGVSHRPKALPLLADRLRAGRYTAEVAIQFGRMAEKRRLYLIFCQLKIDG
ncbi:MAG TPA: hypothetical protein VG842_10055 [Sediminibacterium sp.]|nr:hypothetical protein [Sediminibacterium sp.]